ncbi:hypothetical protein HRbin36_00926 [bacterium HR36]|uniref:Hypothetical conserved protein n=1 Tax=uncultured Planctomycetota bacterium TaxID=120965 RepID=H5SC15_9BACT|nr:hypothetical conserved protein [uncultured Planctomycetota bacterium]GBD35811.1 hypothetical protein HRbin36_00926 [bacterium HR36]
MSDYQITGPYGHKNLAVFLLHSPQQHQRQFLTLDEGLKSGLVKVTEKASAQVNELMVENDSDLPLFLQEGDRLFGGKQDRILYASLVVPPKSGPNPVPAFCVEPGRWSEGRSGERFEATTNSALAPLRVRNAAKLAKSQQQVWQEVANFRFHHAHVVRAGADSFGRVDFGPSTSLNEVLDDPAVVKLTQDYTAALETLLQDKPDAVGVAIAVQGRFVEVNIYPNHQLLRRMYPRLLQSHVLDAISQKGGTQASSHPTPENLRRLLTEGRQKQKRTERVNALNRLEIIELEFQDAKTGQWAHCMSYYDEQPIHLQWVSVNQPTEMPDNPVPDTRDQRPRLLQQLNP